MNIEIKILKIMLSIFFKLNDKTVHINRIQDKIHIIKAHAQKNT